MKLTNVRILGRYTSVQEGKNLTVNVHKGRRSQRGTDHLFFLRSGKRVFIPDSEFYSSTWKKVPQ